MPKYNLHRSSARTVKSSMWPQSSKQMCLIIKETYTIWTDVPGTYQIYWNTLTTLEHWYVYREYVWIIKLVCRRNQFKSALAQLFILWQVLFFLLVETCQKYYHIFDHWKLVFDHRKHGVRKWLHVPIQVLLSHIILVPTCLISWHNNQEKYQTSCDLCSKSRRIVSVLIQNICTKIH